jgi:pilus assembly protein CpaC
MQSGASRPAPAPSSAAVVTSRDAGATIEIVVGSSTLVSLPGRVQTVVLAHPTVADAQPVAPREVVLVGREMGTTDVIFRLESGDTVVRKLRVGVDDTELESRLRRIFGLELDAEDVGGTVTLRGSVPDVQTGALLTSFMEKSGMKWVDLTRIAGVQQVQLRVRIAEASRVALRELAFGASVGGQSAFGGIQAPGGSPFQPVSMGPAPLSPVGSQNFVNTSSGIVQSATTLFGGIPGANLEIYLQALSENRYVRLLAEPNLVAVSGQQATFLVGGEFPIPIVQGSVVGGGSTVTIEYKEFGVRLNFRPEVLGEGRIRLEVSPEVSELSEIGALRQNGFTIPSVVVRRSSTTVELGSGQSFALAGLLRSKDQARASRVPVLGDMPILGALFRSVRYEQDQTELVVLVTAELVEPLDDGADRPLPGELHQAPNDWELFVNGSLSGAVNMGNPMARLKSLGLEGLKGPGAWRRPDEPRVIAADALPGPSASRPPEPSTHAAVAAQTVPAAEAAATP